MSERQIQAIANWLLNKDTGASSETIAGVLLGGKAEKPCHPYDPDDFKRCYTLIKMIPNGDILFVNRMRGVSKNWDAIVEHWSELCALWEEDRKSVV